MPELCKRVKQGDCPERGNPPEASVLNAKPDQRISRRPLEERPCFLINYPADKIVRRRIPEIEFDRIIQFHQFDGSDLVRDSLPCRQHRRRRCHFDCRIRARPLTGKRGRGDDLASLGAGKKDQAGSGCHREDRKMYIATVLRPRVCSDRY